MDALIAAAAPTVSAERKKVHRLLQLLSRIAPVTPQRGFGGAATTGEWLAAELASLAGEATAIAGVPASAKNWDSLRGALRSHTQLLTLATGHADATGNDAAAREAEHEHRLICNLWAELELETAHGKTFHKVRATLDSEIDVLSRRDQPFGIAGMVGGSGPGPGSGAATAATAADAQAQFQKLAAQLKSAQAEIRAMKGAAGAHADESDPKADGKSKRNRRNRKALKVTVGDDPAE